MKILMCDPRFYGIEYEINPWMDIKRKVNHQAAIDQWQQLYQTIQDCGAEIELVPPILGCPDMVFTANAGVVYNNKIILSHFKHKERQSEKIYFQEWFEKNGFDVVDPEISKNNPFFFEGAGDALQAGEILFAAYGFRSQREFYETCDLFDHKKLIYCELQDPYFYHLDTCFCPIDDETAIWYPQGFTEESQNRMKGSNIELISVTAEEARMFVCNAVVLDNHIILPAYNTMIQNKLEKKGFVVHVCEMNEFIKAGGACKCLTLLLNTNSG